MTWGELVCWLKSLDIAQRSLDIVAAEKVPGSQRKKKNTDIFILVTYQYICVLRYQGLSSFRSKSRSAVYVYTCVYVYLSSRQSPTSGCVSSGARVAAHRNVTCRAGAGFANEHAAGFNRASERERERAREGAGAGFANEHASGFNIARERVRQRERQSESWGWICI